MTRGVQMWVAQGQGASRALIGVFKVDQDFRMAVLALRMKARRRSLSTCPTPGAKQGLEKVAECSGIGAREAATVLKTGIPVGRRPERLASLPLTSQLVIRRAFLRAL